MIANIGARTVETPVIPTTTPTDTFYMMSRGYIPLQRFKTYHDLVPMQATA